MLKVQEIRENREIATRICSSRCIIGELLSERLINIPGQDPYTI